jgi:outer membrane protein assembly factor BamB
MSYSDGVFVAQLNNGLKLSATRTIPQDNFAFFNPPPGGVVPVDPVAALYPSFVGCDGDVSSGIFYYERKGRKYVATATKTATLSLIDITNIGSCDDNDAIYVRAQYIGTDTALGGVNYQSTYNNGVLYAVCSNANYIIGSRGSQGQFEQFVTREGEIFGTKSFTCATRLGPLLRVAWNTTQGDNGNPSEGTASYYNGVVFTGDARGAFYGFNADTGDNIWTYDTQTTQQPQNGGPTSFSSANGFIIAINNYGLPALGAPGGSRAVTFEIPCSSK